MRKQWLKNYQTANWLLFLFPNRGVTEQFYFCSRQKNNRLLSNEQALCKLHTTRGNFPPTHFRGIKLYTFPPCVPSALVLWGFFVHFCLQRDSWIIVFMGTVFVVSQKLSFARRTTSRTRASSKWSGMDSIFLISGLEVLKKGLHCFSLPIVVGTWGKKSTHNLPR